MTDIILKQGTGVPSDSDLEVAEVAIDSSSGAMYTKLADGSVEHLNPKGGSASGGLSGQWEYSGSASAGKFSSRNQDWYTATTFSFHNTDAGGGKHTLALVSEGDVIVLGSEDGLKGAEYRVLSVATNVDVYTFTVDPISFFGQFFTDGEMANADFVPQLGVGTVEEAPDDGKLYGRQSEAWAEITSTGGGESLWEQNGSNIYYDAGNVGIGTSTSFTSGLDVSTSGSELAPSGAKITGRFSVGDAKSTSVMIGANDTGTPHGVIAGANALGFYTYNSGWFNRMTIDSTGNVGIGMSPLRSTAKEQLAEWKSRFDARLKDDPKADKKAVTLEITDDAFEVLPSEDKLAEWMETRAAGDKLQVSGNISASGTVSANKVTAGAGNKFANIETTRGNNGFFFKASYGEGGATTTFDHVGGGTAFSINPINGEMNVNGNATFSGAADRNVVTFSAAGRPLGTLLKLQNDKGNWNLSSFPSSAGTTFDIYNEDKGESALKFDSNSDATFSGTVDAAGFTVNGVPIGGGASGNFVDKDTTTAQTIKSTLTGPDFIATSDERLKDNITTAPVGLIDSLKGREWDWSESGEKGSGVVAQELEQVLPHLVHEDDDGMKSVSYNGLVAYLIEELKDCRQRIAELEAKA